jgi:hypothetical protein
MSVYKLMKTTLCILLLFPIAQLMGQGIMTIGSGTISTTATTHIIIAGNGNLSNNGTITLANGSWVHFSGTTQEIKGSNTLDFDNLEANATAVNVARNIGIRSSLLMNAGFFDLKDATVTLSSTGSITGGETNGKRVRATNNSGTEGLGNGTIQITVNNPSGNVANLGIDIAPAANMGSTTIVRGHHQLQGTGSFTGNYSINRSYSILSTTQSDVTINRFYYFPDELGFQSSYAANLQLFQMLKFGSNPEMWDPQATTIAASYVSSVANPSDRSSYLLTLGSTSAPLPVELTSFSATCADEGIQIKWQTATETNASYFSLEKSSNGIDYLPLVQEPAQGNSNTLVNYSATDHNPNSDLNYYRLVQYDFNGTAYSYNPIVAQCLSVQEETITPIYPNYGEVFFELSGNVNETYSIVITNAIGQTIARQSVTLENQGQSVKFENLNIAAGLYHASLISKNKRISTPFVIKESN